jgi:hypothetical protein
MLQVLRQFSAASSAKFRLRVTVVRAMWQYDFAAYPVSVSVMLT